ncbi:hypothetical protein KDL01_36475 [Actinospica durhamensis]|uniref:Uncharacterized protein n=1 Tax=Actinospica durhamensis TaxID=1508375 RepID=A0A941EXJ3_9ACTN|nr:hypothetical protein [Actinospica durhamensis]MBR7838821.1 hypothetical protein [Actinospica durhamensis]
MNMRGFGCAVAAVALLSVAGPAALAHAGTRGPVAVAHAATAGPCDAKLLASFRADDAVQSAQDGLTAAQQALKGADYSAKILQAADTSIREGILALPWTKGSLRAQLNLGQAVRTYKSLYLKAVYSGSATSAGDPSAAAQSLTVAARKLIEDAKAGSDQGSIFVMRLLTQGAGDMRAVYPLFVTIPARKADLAQATQQADKVQSGVSVARTALETCLQNAAGKS